MPESISKDEFLKAWGRVLSRMEASADELNRLDGAAGDGDLGVTVTLGCKAVRKALPDLVSQDIGTILARSGMAFNTAASSTFGALFAIGTMRAGKEAKGAESLDLALIARMLRAAEQGIMEKGKAQRGDKTLLDSLGPAIDALEAAAGRDATMSEALGEATAAARAGVEATRGMTARSGRAAWIAERSSGEQDPGATLILRMFEAYETKG